MAASAARTHFREELARLEAQALGALDLVVSTLDRTLEALHHRDIELASIVIQDDDRIDGRYLEVHQGILSLLALQAPVASDLRVVAALLHVIKNAERMGDQCVNIAKVLPISGYEPPTDDQLLETVERMAQLARSEVGQSMQGFRAAFAPAGLCTPGKLFPPPRLCGEVPGPYRAHPLEKAGLAERL